MKTPRDFASKPEGQDAVIFHMTVPTDFPILALSYPEEQRAGDPGPLCILGQQEVLVGASTFSEVHLQQTEQKEGYRLYHVAVRLKAVPRENVLKMIQSAQAGEIGSVQQQPVIEESVQQQQPVMKDQLNIARAATCNIFHKRIDELEEGKIYERADQEDVKYKLVEKGFICRFDRVRDSGTEEA